MLPSEKTMSPPSCIFRSPLIMVSATATEADINKQYAKPTKAFFIDIPPDSMIGFWV
jgi:hypothetical protein